MNVRIASKHVISFKKFLILFFCVVLTSSAFVQAINLSNVTDFYMSLPAQGFSWIFGRWDAATFYCQNGTNGLVTTGAFASLWNDNVETNNVVRLMPENFTVTASLYLPTGVQVEGSGRSSVSSSPSGGTILTLSYDGNVFASSGNPSQGVTISDLTINGQRHQRTAGTGIYGKFRNLLVSNVFIMDMDTDGIALEDTTNTVDCWDNHIVNCHIWWIDEYGVRAGTRATDITIEGGHIAYCDIAGFYTTVGGHKLSSVTLDCSHYNVYVYGGSARLSLCNIDQAHRHNIYLQSLSGDPTTTTNIIGCKIRKASTETANTYSQIYLQGYGTTYADALKNIIIAENQFISAGYAKYCVEIAGINEANITINANDFNVGYETAAMNAIPTDSTIGSNEGFTAYSPVCTYGTFTLQSNMNEQTMITLTPSLITEIYNFYFDVTALTYNATIKVYSKINGASWTEMSDMSKTAKTTDYGIVLKGFWINTDLKITIQSDWPEASTRSIPYRYFTEEW